jgi:hypothetical protein
MANGLDADQHFSQGFDPGLPGLGDDDIRRLFRASPKRFLEIREPPGPIRRIQTSPSGLHTADGPDGISHFR